MWKLLFSRTSFYTRIFICIYKKGRALCVLPIALTLHQEVPFAQVLNKRESLLKQTEPVKLTCTGMCDRKIKDRCYRLKDCSGLNQSRTAFINFNPNVALNKVLNWKERTHNFICDEKVDEEGINSCMYIPVNNQKIKVT